MGRRMAAGRNHVSKVWASLPTKLFLNSVKLLGMFVGRWYAFKDGVVQSLNISAMLRVGFVFCEADAGSLWRVECVNSVMLCIGREESNQRIMTFLTRKWWWEYCLSVEFVWGSYIYYDLSSAGYVIAEPSWPKISAKRGAHFTPILPILPEIS